MEQKVRDKVTEISSAEHGLLDSMYNLACEEGHRFYAPKPQNWIGHDCNVVRTLARCGKKMRLITS